MNLALFRDKELYCPLKTDKILDCSVKCISVASPSQTSFSISVIRLDLDAFNFEEKAMQTPLIKHLHVSHNISRL